MTEAVENVQNPKMQQYQIVFPLLVYSVHFLPLFQLSQASAVLHLAKKNNPIFRIERVW